MARSAEVSDRTSAPAAPRRRRGRLHVGPFQITPIRVVVLAALLGSAGFIAWAVLRVRDSNQIPMLSTGFAVLGLSLAAVALGAVINLWRAASYGRSGRALVLSIMGGVIALAAIGCFTAAVLFALLWQA